MRGLEKRIGKLEQQTGGQDNITMEILVASSFGDEVCIKKVDAAEARGDDPLLKLILEAGEAA
jgi:hypothetical protein